MIHVFIGTKAQYVKMAPVILELDRRGIPYNLIDSGQHRKLSEDYRAFFGIREPDVLLRRGKEDIAGIPRATFWITALTVQTLLFPRRSMRVLFRGEPGVCLVHGDTPTTLISTIAARRCGISVVHVESGLRSHNLWHPFPEEIIRLLVMRWATTLLANSHWARENLRRMGYAGKTVTIEGNTNRDALGLLLTRSPLRPPQMPGKVSYAVFSIHRVETILNRSRLNAVVQLALRVAEKHHVLFCIHPPTRKQLNKSGLMATLMAHTNITAVPLLPYPQFIDALRLSAFAVSDGGSIQEECFYLGVPSLVMRYHTERQEGLSENAVLSKFDARIIEDFIGSSERFRRPPQTLDGPSPSAAIVDYLQGEPLRLTTSVTTGS